MNQKPSAILFDLGGVLVELNQHQSFVPWFDQNLSPSENWRQWLTAPLPQLFEQGRLTPEEFARQYIDRNNLAINIQDFLKIFRSWVVGFYPGVFPMLEQLSRSYPLGIFSNTNAIHWPPLRAQLQHHGSVSHFFASYQIGLAKPDPAAFNYVAKSMDISPAGILFLDDNGANVNAARTSGFIAEQVTGFEQIHSVLKSHGIDLEHL